MITNKIQQQQQQQQQQNDNNNKYCKTSLQPKDQCTLL
jgi:hypothetical protein